MSSCLSGKIIYFCLELTGSFFFGADFGFGAAAFFGAAFLGATLGALNAANNLSLLITFLGAGVSFLGALGLAGAFFGVSCLTFAMIVNY
jgi:hypothetical protein